MSKYIWIKNKRYYWYGTYDKWEQAYALAKYYHKKNRKNRYYIQISEDGFLFPQKKYRLYLTHVIKMGLFG